MKRVISWWHNPEPPFDVVIKVHREDDKVTKSNARATIEFAVTSGLIDTAHETGLTIDKCDNLISAVVDEIFDVPVRWAVEEYLREIQNAISN